MIRLHCGKAYKQAAFDVEFSSEEVGIVLQCEDPDRSPTCIAQLLRAEIAETYPQIKIGSILIAVNKKIVVYEDFEDIIEFLAVLREARFVRCLRFLDLSICPLEEFIEKMSLEHKSHIDRYGFLQSRGYLNNEKTLARRKESSLVARDIALVDYFKRIGGYRNVKPSGAYTPPKDLKRLVRLGISPAFRGKIWSYISLSNRKRMLYPQDYFQNLINDSSAPIYNYVRYEIDKDIPRTFTKHHFFCGDEGQNSLRNVLNAYAVHNHSVGYCQSMNFVAGLMLIFTTEEDAFWLLATVIEEILPKESYGKSLLGFHIEMYVMYSLIQEYVPRLGKIFRGDEASLRLSICIMPWFMCLFINTLSPETLLRVWDIFLNEGSEVLLRVALALLILFEDRILLAADIDEALLVLKGIGREIVDPDEMLKIAFSSNLFREGNETSCCASDLKCMSLEKDTHLYKNHETFPQNLEGIGLAHIGPYRPDLIFSYSDYLRGNDEPSLQSPSQSQKVYIDESYVFPTYFPSPFQLWNESSATVNNINEKNRITFKDKIDSLRIFYSDQLADRTHENSTTDSRNTAPQYPSPMNLSPLVPLRGVGGVEAPVLLTSEEEKVDDQNTNCLILILLQCSHK